MGTFQWLQIRIDNSTAESPGLSSGYRLLDVDLMTSDIGPHLKVRENKVHDPIRRQETSGFDITYLSWSGR